MRCLSIVGLGYIGLPTAVLAAQSGYQVFGFDIDEKRIEKINSGISPFIEPEIAQRLAQVIKKNFFVSSNLEPADCFLIAVPTPFKQDSDSLIKKADLSHVFDAAEKVAKVLRPGNLVILESTVPVGTTYEVAKFLEKETGFRLGIDLFVAYCPERVLPGKIFEELVKNDRVIGGICQGSAYLAKNFYSKFVKGKMHLVDDKTAEMVKLVENSSRDVQIAFANQVAAMCKTVGINPFEVIECANKHPRVNILNPGCGVGGHCIAVDPWFLVESFPQDSEILKMDRKINDDRPQEVVEEVLTKVRELKMQGEVAPKVLALGLAFKSDVDDLRESPALKIATKLKKCDDQLVFAVCEPNVSGDKLQKIGFEKDMELLDGIRWADVILILVKHKEFNLLKDLNLKNKIIVDTCGLLGCSNKNLDFEQFCSNFKTSSIVSKSHQVTKNL